MPPDLQVCFVRYRPPNDFVYEPRSLSYSFGTDRTTLGCRYSQPSGQQLHTPVRAANIPPARTAYRYLTAARGTQAGGRLGLESQTCTCPMMLSPTLPLRLLVSHSVPHALYIAHIKVDNVNCLRAIQGRSLGNSETAISIELVALPSGRLWMVAAAPLSRRSRRSAQPTRCHSRRPPR